MNALFSEATNNVTKFVMQKQKPGKKNQGLENSEVIKNWSSNREKHTFTSRNVK